MDEPTTFIPPKINELLKEVQDSLIEEEKERLGDDTAALNEQQRNIFVGLVAAYTAAERMITIHTSLFTEAFRDSVAGHLRRAGAEESVARLIVDHMVYQHTLNKGRQAS